MASHLLVKVCFSPLTPPDTHWPPHDFLCLYFLTLLRPLWIQHARDRVRKLRPSGTFLAQLFLSCGRHLVKLCPLLFLGDSPFRFDPFLSFQPMQRRIERTRIHLQQLAGAIPDSHANPVAMLRTPLQGLQNQQVQRPLQKLDPVLVPLSVLGHRFVPQSIPFTLIGSLERSCHAVFSLALLVMTS